MQAPNILRFLFEPQLERGTPDILEKWASVWLELCERSGDDLPFYRPEWVGAYLRAFEPKSTVVLATARHGSHLSGVLPLIEENASFCGFPIKKLRGAANIHSCRFDIVRARAEEGEKAVRMIWESLKALHDWDLIELPYVPGGGGIELLQQMALQEGFPTSQEELYKSPYIPLAGIEDTSGIPGDSHFRQNLRRRMRNAQSRYGVRLIRVDRADPVALLRFYELERSGWKGASASAIACTQNTQRFYDEIARSGTRYGYFVLYLLEFGDQTVAGHFGMIHKGRYYCPKVSYDERFGVYGPGHLIVNAILSDLLRNNIGEFDFLGPWMDWKAQWTQQGRSHSRCYIFRPGLFGRTLRMARIKLRSTQRRILGRPPAPSSDSE